MEVGDYVRTKKGYIAKYKGIEKCNNIDGESEDWFIFDSTIIDDYGDRVPVEINKSYFIKTSPNIIDLIEVGDYVNGYKVLNVLDFNDNSKMLSLEKIYDSKITNEEIKSILTKEQFEEMEYKCTN